MSNPSPNTAGAVPAKTFEELIAYDWILDPGVEAYYCIYQTLTQDVWVSDYRALTPTGTHHVTVGYSDPGPPDGAVSSANSSTCTGLTLGTNVAFTATLAALDPPAILNKGDVGQTSCTYQNQGPDTLTFGESTTKNEMCISIMYRYPAVASSFNCAQ